MGKLTSLLRISRTDVQFLAVAHPVVGITLGLVMGGSVGFLPVALYVAGFMTASVFAYTLNSICDREVDELHNPKLCEAVDDLGEKAFAAVLTAEASVTVGISAALLYLGHPWPGAILVVGLILSYFYSSLPVRLKARGFAGVFGVMVGVYTLPVIGGYVLTGAAPGVELAVLCAGYASLNQGFTLVRTLIPYPKDRDLGLVTSAHIMGSRGTILLASFLVFTGFVPGLLVLNWTVNGRGGFLSLLAASFYVVMVMFSFLDVASLNRNETPEELARERTGRFTLWLAATRFPLLLTFLLIFFEI